MNGIAAAAIEHIRLVATYGYAVEAHPALAAVLAALGGGVINGTPYICTATTLNIRTGPGVTYPSVGTLKTGQVVIVYAVQSGWAKHDLGWSSVSYLKKIGG